MSLSLTTEQKQIIKDAINECVSSNIRIAAEKDLQKDIAERIQEKLGVKKADFGNMVKEVYEKKVSEQLAKLTDVVDMVNMVFDREID